jgi:lipoprotein-anchoring transpeptidase ErfK/SrfK
VKPKPKPRTLALSAAAVLIVVAAAAGAVIATASAAPPARSTQTATPRHAAAPTPSPSPRITGHPLPQALTVAEIAALPAATYDAVIPALLAAPSETSITAAYSLDADTPLYGADRVTPVARFEAKNFLDESSVIVPVAIDGDWSLVLTPSRQTKPSQTPAGTTAAAQTVAWVPTRDLRRPQPLPNRIVISISQQTLAITDATGMPLQTFPVGVGTPDTPTPTGVTGYVEARYLDPAQGQAVHPIQLTSLHATAADEPYGGSDGGLIGIHYEEESSGAVSHGCVRLDENAIEAVNALALGTPVSIVA